MHKVCTTRAPAKRDFGVLIRRAVTRRPRAVTRRPRAVTRRPRAVTRRPRAVISARAALPPDAGLTGGAAPRRKFNWGRCPQTPGIFLERKRRGKDGAKTEKRREKTEVGVARQARRGRGTGAEQMVRSLRFRCEGGRGRRAYRLCALLRFGGRSLCALCRLM